MIGRTSMLPIRAEGILDADLDRLVQVPGLDQVEAAQLLLGLGERAVGGGHLAVAHPDGRGGLRRLQRVAAEVVAALLDVLGEARNTRP